MSADPARRTARAAILTTLMVLAATAAATGQTERTSGERVEPDEAIERARALEREGRLDDAYVYLYQLTEGNEDLERDAGVLLELSRLAPEADESVGFLERAAEAARGGATVAEARRQLGDYLYARGSYMEAAEQYGAAAGRASEPTAGFLLLKQAAATLAAGDAGAAAEQYRRLTERGSTPDEVAPWAILGLGRALLVKGDSLGAALEFETFVDTYREHEARPRALAGAAEARTAAGDVVGARSALELLVAEYPESHEAALARGDLRSLPPDTTGVGGVPVGEPADDEPGVFSTTSPVAEGDATE